MLIYNRIQDEMVWLVFSGHTLLAAQEILGFVSNNVFICHVDVVPNAAQYDASSTGNAHVMCIKI